MGLCYVELRCTGPCFVGLLFGAVVCGNIACVGGDAVGVHCDIVMGVMGAKKSARLRAIINFCDNFLISCKLILTINFNVSNAGMKIKY